MTEPAAPRLSRRITGYLRRLALGRVPTLFDTAYYLRTHPDAAASGLDPFLHYVLIGGRRGYDPNADFDTAFYRTQVRTRLDPLRHYLKIGAAKGFDPHPSFSTFGYLGRYPDVVAVKANPLQHYREHGRAERRIADQSGRLPRAMMALTGIPSAHHWTLPGRDRTRFGLTLMREAAAAPDAEPVARLRIALCLEFDAVDGVVDVLARFPAGVQDAVGLDLTADPARGAGVPSLLLALDHCHMEPVAGDGTRTVRYAQAAIWDLRLTVPRVLANLPDGTIRLGAAGAFRTTTGW